MAEYSMHKQRELLLQCIYQILFAIDNKMEYDATEIFLNAYGIKKYEDSPIFSQSIYFITLDKFNEIKKIIDQNLNNWTFERVDKSSIAILFISLAEGLYYCKTPRKVIINEAINLSKDFSDKNNYKFINGVLDKVLPK